MAHLGPGNASRLYSDLRRADHTRADCTCQADSSPPLPCLIAVASALSVLLLTFAGTPPVAASRVGDLVRQDGVLAWQTGDAAGPSQASDAPHHLTDESHHLTGAPYNLADAPHHLTDDSHHLADAPHRLTQTTVDMEAVADATIASISPDGAFGLQDYLEVWYRNARDIRHSLIRFNLAAAVPAEAVIEEAHLELQLEGAAGANPVDLTAALLTEDWVESQVTWNNRPASGEPVVVNSVDSTLGPKRLDVTDVVRAWHNVPHYGLELRGPGDGTVFDRVFESRQHNEAVPRLYVTYHVPPTPTSTATAGTPPPTPTASATLPGNCPELIDNGDFETGSLAGWGSDGAVGLGLGRLSTHGAWLGGEDEAGGELWQVVRVRAGAAPVRLSYWWVVEREAAQPGDALEVILQYGDEQVDHLRTHSGAEPPGVWLQDVVDLQDYAGMELAVTFLVHTDAEVPSTFSLDEVSLRACGGATDTPEPTDVPTDVPTGIPTAIPTDVPTAVATPTGTETDGPTPSPSDTMTPTATTADTSIPTTAATGTTTATDTTPAASPSATSDPDNTTTPSATSATSAATASPTGTAAIGTGLCTWTDVSPGPGSTPQPNTPWKASIWGKMLSMDVTGVPGVIGPATSWTTYDGPTLVDGMAAADQDGRLMLFFSYPGSPWKAVDITEKTGRKIAIERPAYWLFTDTKGPYEKLAVPAVNGDLYVFAWRAETDWRATNVSTQTGAKIQGPVAAWVTTSGSTEVEHVAARSTSNDLLVFQRQAGSGSTWQMTNVSGATGQQIAGPAEAWTVSGGAIVTERLAAPAANGDLLLFTYEPSPGWSVINLTTATGQKVNGRMTSWIAPSGPKSENIAGAAPNGDLVIIHSDPIEGGWGVTNVTSATGQRTASEATSWQTQSGTTAYEHLAVEGPNGHLYAFHKASGGSWQVKDVTGVTGTTITSAPTSWVSDDGTTATEYLAAPSWDGRLYAFRWDPTKDWQETDVSVTAAGRTVFAASEKAGVWRSPDYGITWGQLTRPQPAQGAQTTGALDVPVVHDVVVSPDDPLLIVAAAGQDRRSPSRAGIYRSVDGGASWTQVHQFFCGGQVQPATQVVAAPGGFETLYAVGGCAVAVSNDSGETWTDSVLPGTGGWTRAWHVAVSESLPGDVRRAYACGSGTLWYSHDSGTNWYRDNSATGTVPGVFCGPTTLGNGDGAQTLAVEPGNPSRVFMSLPNSANGPSFFHAEEAGVDGVHCNNPVVYDDDNDGVFDTGEARIAGLKAVSGDTLIDDAKILFVDTDGDNTLDATEAVVFDASGDGKYGTVSTGKSEMMLRGAAPVAGTTLADDPKLKRVAMGQSYGSRGCGEGSLWYGDLSSFNPSSPTTLSGAWSQLPGPPVYWGAGDSGGSFVRTHETKSGYLLFFSDQGTLHVSEGKPTDGGWYRMEGWNISKNKRETDSSGTNKMHNIVAVHVDPHGLVISPDFDLTLKPVRDQRMPYNANKELDTCVAGRLWYSNDGGIFRTDDCGVTWIRAEVGLSTLAAINVGGVARASTPPALFFGTGDNDDFHSQDGGKTWRSSVDACADCGTWFADPLQPDRVLSTSRTIVKAGTFGIYANPGGYPDPAVKAQQTLVPPPATPAAATGAKLIQRPGFRPIVQTLAGQSPLANGDYVQIQGAEPPAPTPGWRRLMRARDSVGDASPWAQVGPDLPSSVTVVQAAGGHASPTFYVGDYTNLWKSHRDNQGDVDQWQLIVPGGGAAVAQRFFVNPFDANDIYILDSTGVRHSTDGGTTWPLDAQLDSALTDGGEYVNTCHSNASDYMHLVFDVCALNDMVFDQLSPNTRFAVGMAGVFYSGDGSNWLRLLDTRALPSRPTGAYFNPITDSNDRALYVAFLGRGVMRCNPIPATPPTPAPTSTSVGTPGPSPTPTVTPTSLPSAPLPGMPLIDNGGFEAEVLAPWDTSGAVELVGVPVHGGLQSVRLGTVSSADELSQTVELPADADSITLSYWWYIDSEDDWPPDGDKLRLVLDTDEGAALLQTLTNASPLFQWRQSWYDLSAYRGQSITVMFRADENRRDPTSFFLDDVRVDAHYGPPPIYVPIAPQRVPLSTSGELRGALSDGASLPIGTALPASRVRSGGASLPMTTALRTSRELRSALSGGASLPVAAAAPCEELAQEEQPELSLVGQLGGTSWAVVADGNRLFAGAGPRMYVYDSADPANLRVAGRTAVLAGMPVAILVSGDVAYVATWDYVVTVLYVIDVRKSAEPTIIGSVPLLGPISGMDVFGDYVYVAAGRHGLQAVDVSDPRSPWRAAILALPDGATDVDIVDGLAYVAGGEEGLRVVDVSDVGSLSEVAHVGTPGNARSVTVRDGYAYVGDGRVIHGAGPSFRVIDVGDPHAPVEVGHLKLTDDPYSLIATGDDVYIAAWGAGLVVLDVTVKSQPQRRTRTDLPGMAQGVAVSRRHAFVADDLDGLQVIDMAASGGPMLIRRRPVLRMTRGVDVEGAYAFVAEGTRSAGGVRMLDISDPANPFEIAHHDTTGDPLDPAGPIDFVHAAGGYVYAVGYGGDGLHVLEVTGEPSLKPVGYLPIGFARSVFAAGTYAYVARQYGLTIVDVSTPSHPVTVSTLDVQGAYRVQVLDEYAYVSASGGLHVIDVSAPSDPEEVSYIEYFTSNAHVVGDTAYLVGSYGLAIVDVADRSAPAFVGQLSMDGSLTSIQVRGDLAFITTGQSGLAVIDVSDPTAPSEITSLDVLEYTYQVDVAGSEIYLAGSRMGLGVLHLLGVPGAEPGASPTPEPTAPATTVPTPSQPMPNAAFLPIVGNAMTFGDDPSRPPVGSWTHYVDSNVVLDIAADPDGSGIWAATTGGVVAWDARDGSYRTLTTDDGLAGNYTYSVAVDADGDRWFGTWRGLNRLTADGHLETYVQEDGLPGEPVLDILVAADGSRWFATDVGITILDRGDDWHQVRKKQWPATAMAQDPVTGDIWFAHGNAAPGATRLHADGSLSQYGVDDGLALPHVTSVAVDGGGTAWFSAVRRHASDSNHMVEAAVVSLAPDGTWVRHAAGDGVLAAEWSGGRLDSPYLEGINAAPLIPGSPHSGEMVWLGHACPGGQVEADASGRVALISYGGCPNSAKVATAQDAGASAAVVTSGKGPDDPLMSAAKPHRMLLQGAFTIPALMIDAQSGDTLRTALGSEGAVTVTLSSQPGLVDDFVTALAIDGDGTPWFAAVGAVGHKAADGTWQSYVDDDYLHDKTTTALAIDRDDALWIGTYSGLRRKAADDAWSTHETDGPAGTSIRAVTFADDGTTWVGTWGGGASRVSPDGQWTAYRRYQSPPWVDRSEDSFIGEGYVRAIEIDAFSGYTWFGTEAGAVALEEDGSWTRFSTADGLASDWLEDILARDDGSVWFATNRGASVRYPDGSWLTYTDDDGLASAQVRDIAESPSGDLWFACFEGASRLAPDGTWRSYTMADGIGGADVREVEIDAEGAVWVGTNMGVSRIRADGSWQHYPTRSGTRAMAADPERGGVWHGWRHGLEHMAPDGSRFSITSEDGLLSDFISEVAVAPGGRIWIGTQSAGLSVLDPELRGR